LLESPLLAAPAFKAHPATSNQKSSTFSNLFFFQTIKMARPTKKSTTQAAAPAQAAPAPAPAQAETKGSATKRSNKNADGTVRKVKHRPGTNTLNQIRKLQRNPGPVMPLKPFNDLVRSIGVQIAAERTPENGTPIVYRYKPDTITTLREAEEAEFVKLFQDAGTVSRHGKKVTLSKKDIFEAEDVSRPSFWMTHVYKRQVDQMVAAKAKKSKLGKKSKKSSTKKSSAKKTQVAAAPVESQ
jgi:histone H3/H4